VLKIRHYAKLQNVIFLFDLNLYQQYKSRLHSEAAFVFNDLKRVD